MQMQKAGKYETKGALLQMDECQKIILIITNINSVILIADMFS